MTSSLSPDESIPAAVSTWDTEEHARYSPDALGDVMSRIRAPRVQVDPPEIFEVTIS